MKYNCKIINSNKLSEPTVTKNSPQDSDDKTKILAEINDQKIIAQDGEISLINAKGISQWKSPLKIEGKPNKLFVSQDRLLLTTFSNDYHEWGFLGPAFLIDTNDGSIIAELRGETGAALKNGSFLLGLEGYDCFNTWLYDRNGKRIQEWRSYGHYIVGKDDDIRVLEKDRQIPTKSRVVRLKLDGQIEKGPVLKDAQISDPLVLDDNALLFVDCGTIRIIDFHLKDQYKEVLIDVDPRDSWRFHSHIRFKGDDVIVDICERPEDSSIEYTHHSWLLKLSCAQ